MPQINKQQSTNEQKKFLMEYKHLLAKEGLQVPTDSTLIKDANRCNVTFQSGTSQSNYCTEFNHLGKLLSPEIRQIRLNYKTYNDILLDISTYSFEISKFKSKIKKIRNNPKRTSSDSTLAYLSFILKDTGLEEYIENVFFIELFGSPELLYIEKCRYCVKIYFEFQHYDAIMSKVFEIVEKLKPS